MVFREKGVVECFKKELSWSLRGDRGVSDGVCGNAVAGNSKEHIRDDDIRNLFSEIIVDAANAGKQRHQIY